MSQEVEEDTLKISKDLSKQSPTGTYYVKYVGLKNGMCIFIDKKKNIIMIDKTHINQDDPPQRLYCYTFQIRDLRPHSFKPGVWIGSYPVFIYRTNSPGTEVDLNDLDV